MKKFLLSGILLAMGFSGQAQMYPSVNNNNKNNFFISWGWNRASYTHSDIHFKGQDYDFILKSVVAKDRQTPFTLRYLNPTKMTIPQYNFRVGYYISPKYSISFGFDHMKYVMQQDQTVIANGTISNSGTEYDKSYNNEPVELTKNFLQFEHTNGLNYLNLELRRTDRLLGRKQLGIKNVEVNLIQGAGFGILYPKTDVTLLSFDRNDQWHIAGYGLGAVVGLNVTVFKHFFIQGEVKGGYINMPDILTTNFPEDHATQHFFFLQRNVNFGAKFPLW